MITPQYLAGFIDGEGYLGVIRHTNKECKRGYHFTIGIKIAQSERNGDILLMIHEKLGGHLDKVRIHKKNQSNSRMLSFMGNINVRKVLDYVYPYLIVKKGQADVLYKFLEVKVPTTRKPIIVDVEMDKMYKLKEELYIEIRKLNKTGKTGLAETE